MCTACRKSDLHVGDGRACEGSDVSLLLQMSEDEALPVQVKVVGVDGRIKHQSASPWQWLHEQMHFGIVSQRFVMANALGCELYSLLVGNCTVCKSHRIAESLGYEALQHFKLHRSHKLYVYLTELLVPDDVKLWVFVLEDAHILQRFVYVFLRGKHDTVGHDRLQHRSVRVADSAYSLPCVGACKSRHSTDFPCLRLVSGTEFLAAVKAYGTYLARDLIAVLIGVGQSLTHIESAAHNLHVGQTASLRVIGYLVDLGSEFALTLRFCGEPVKDFKQFSDPAHFQSRTEHTRKYPPFGYGFGNVGSLKLSLRQILLHQLL